MDDLKTQFNPLATILRLITTLLFSVAICYIIYQFVCYFTTNDFRRCLLLTFILFLFVNGIYTYFKPFIKTTKNYIIKDNSIEEFNLLTSKTTSINKNEIKGFSTSIFRHGVLEYNEIIIYLKDRSKIHIKEFMYFNFEKIESILLAKNYNYLGQDEPFDVRLFNRRIYKYDA